MLFSFSQIIMGILSDCIVFLYFISAAGLMLYGLNAYIMIFFFWKGRKRMQASCQKVWEKYGDISGRTDLPKVTTQIPVYNEMNVAGRVISAVCAMRYPKERHEIQVLDDSTDETRELIDGIADRFRGRGFDIQIIRRKERTGFKAGALARGMEISGGELLAIFDADFVPPEDYLLRTVPFFMDNGRIGLVQTRWGHLNRNASILTRAQSIGIDGHFMVEQAARNWNGLYMNFNGTAGIWRKAAIAEGGGWQWDTLTEDMDLSYRVQFAGWRTLYLPDVVVPAEIPEDMNAFKSQQFRWAKGSIRTAMKLFPQLIRQPVPIFQKIQAVFHMTHYLVHPMMLMLSLLALPVLLLLKMSLTPMIFGMTAFALVISMMAPSALYIVSQKTAYTDWFRRILSLPMLVVVGVGIALSNSGAVWEAVIGKQSGFVRTPKKGDREIRAYRIHLSWLPLFEILMGIYCAFSLDVYLGAGKYLIGPFLTIYAAGFLFVGFLTIAHNMGPE